MAYLAWLLKSAYLSGNLSSSPTDRFKTRKRKPCWVKVGYRFEHSYSGFSVNLIPVHAYISAGSHDLLQETFLDSFTTCHLYSKSLVIDRTVIRIIEHFVGTGNELEV